MGGDRLTYLTFFEFYKRMSPNFKASMIIIAFLILLVIGLINFFLGIYKEHKKLIERKKTKKQRILEKQKENEENESLENQE